MVLFSNDHLGEEIERRAAHIDAALCDWLDLVAEFDAREVWSEWGCGSAAQWLAWRCSLSTRAARDHVRVARRLRELPLVRAAFSRGELSYSKVRALARVEHVADEAGLLEFARVATAAQLERTISAYARCERGERAPVERRFVQLDANDDGVYRLSGCLTADEAAVVQAALDAMRAQAAAEPAEPDGENVAPPSIGEQQADALVAVANAATAGDGERGHGVEVMVHVDVETLCGSAEPRPAEQPFDPLEPVPLTSRWAIGAAEPADGSAKPPHAERLSTQPPRCEVANGPALAVETARRLCCDAGLVVTTERGGRTVDVGRRRRTIPPAIQRALRARDGCCRFPGCTRTRFVQAHHVEFWGHGGATRLDNLVLLCSHHHRLVHEGGYRLEWGRDGAVAVRTPSGRVVESVPRARRGDCSSPQRANRARGADPGPGAAVPGWCGEKLDLGYAVDAMLAFTRRRGSAEPPP